jgi:5-methyltetrahydropteroyltriglutamate--homocysteine methyltransferase
MHITRPLKIPRPGPFLLTQLAQNDYYPDDEALALDLAGAVNAELWALKDAGADVVQLDEPGLHSAPEQAHHYGLAAVNAAMEGIPGPIVLHLCFGYGYWVEDKSAGYRLLRELVESRATHLSLEAAQPNLDLAVLPELGDKTVVLGVLDLGRESPVETPEEVADRVRRALAYVPPERLQPAPDCGMKYLSRGVAFGKLRALMEGMAIVRRELGIEVDELVPSGSAR